MEITNINQLLPFVEKKPEFKVIDKGDYQVIDYVYQDQHTFDQPELMECRGIKFDKDGLIIARPFAKFFNYGERGATLPMHRPHFITRKYDGSMVHPTRVNGQVFLHTRKGHTDVAKKAERFVLSEATGRNYVEFFSQSIHHGVTPIFEYVGPNNRIVLRYEEENLVLLAMRHMVSGEYLSFVNLLASADEFNIPVVTPVDLPMTADPKVDLEGFVKYTRELQDEEGYVLYFDHGYMVKVKAEDYVLKHRALDDLGSKKKVVALCAQGFMDDVLPILSEPDAVELIHFNYMLQDEVNLLEARAKALAKNHGPQRKEFAIKYADKLRPRWLAGVCFGVMDGKDARTMILKAIQSNVDDVTAKWRGQ